MYNFSCCAASRSIKCHTKQPTQKFLVRFQFFFLLLLIRLFLLYFQKLESIQCFCICFSCSYRSQCLATYLCVLFFALNVYVCIYMATVRVIEAVPMLRWTPIRMFAISFIYVSSTSITDRFRLISHPIKIARNTMLPIKRWYMQYMIAFHVSQMCPMPI